MVVILAALMPALVIYVYLTVVMRVDPRNLIPSLSDEIFNWLQVRMMLTAGFDGGYFALAERPAPAAFTHFYTYGPWFVLLYALPARIIGWELHTFGIVNLLFVGLSTVACCLIAQPNKRQVLWMALALGTFWPGILFHYSAFQEGLQQGLGIILAACFYLGITRRAELPNAIKIGVLLLIMVGAALRMSWVALAFPLLLLVLPNHWRGRLIALAGTGVLVLATMVLWNWVGGSANNIILIQVNDLSAAPQSAVVGLFNRFIENLGRYFNGGKPAYDIILSIQVMGTVAVALVASWRARGQARTEALFHLFNMGALFLAGMVLYIVGTGGDYRLLGAHMILSLLLLILSRRWVWVILLIAVNLILMPQFWSAFDSFHRRTYTVDKAPMIAFRDAVAPHVVYDPDETNDWCNTMAFSPWNFRPHLNYIPAGIGLTFFRERDLPTMRFQSRYWLLRPEDLEDVQAQPHAPPLIFMTTTPYGDLYLNSQADCSP
jgi:hypothetical protein